MTLVLVEVPNEAAVEQLRQQKDVHIVGIITKPADEPALPATQPTPRKWAGALAAISTTSAEEWDIRRE